MQVLTAFQEKGQAGKGKQVGGGRVWVHGGGLAGLGGLVGRGWGAGGFIERAAQSGGELLDGKK